MRQRRLNPLTDFILTYEDNKYEYIYTDQNKKVKEMFTLTEESYARCHSFDLG